MKAKNIKELNERMWYRAVKCFYWLSFIFINIWLIMTGNEKTQKSLSGISFFKHFKVEQLGGIEKNVELKTILLYFFDNTFIFIVVTIIIFELIRRLFYYVYFGKVKPNK